MQTTAKSRLELQLPNMSPWPSTGCQYMRCSTKKWILTERFNGLWPKRHGNTVSTLPPKDMTLAIHQNFALTPLQLDMANPAWQLWSVPCHPGARPRHPIEDLTHLCVHQFPSMLYGIYAVPYSTSLMHDISRSEKCPTQNADSRIWILRSWSI